MSTKSQNLMNRFGGTIAQTVRRADTGSPVPAAVESGPDRYSGAVRCRGFAELPVDAITTGAQPRTEFDEGELGRLADSIRRHGQLAPIRVRWDEPTGRWIVLVGERRLRACRLAGLEKVRVELVEREMTEADILAEQVVENVVRADLKPVEQARAYDRLIALNGWSAQELAANLGAEPSGVYRCLALLKLPEDIAGQVDAGAIKPTAAYELSKLDSADDQRAVAHQIVAGRLDHTGTVAEVKTRQKAGKAGKGSKATSGGNKPKSGGQGRGQGPSTRNYRGPRGVKVTVQLTAKHSLEDLVADLRALADQLAATAAA